MSNIQSTHLISCDFCNYQSLITDIIEKHIKGSHPGEGVAICGECGMSFATVKAGFDHISLCVNKESFSQEKVKVNPCDLCRNLFVSNCDLKDHKSEVHGNVDISKDIF